MKTSMAQLVRYVSTLLADQRAGQAFVTWSETQLKGIAVEGISHLKVLSTNVARSTKTVTLTPGDVQKLPDGVLDNVQVVSCYIGTTVHADFDRAEIKALAANVKRTEVKPARSLFRAGCLGDAPTTWALKWWAWDSTISPETFTVSPEVPNDGVQRSVVISYDGDIATDTSMSFNIPTPLYSALVSFMLYRAFSGEVDSDAAKGLADMHWKAYTETIAAVKASKKLI